MWTNGEQNITASISPKTEFRYFYSKWGRGYEESLQRSVDFPHPQIPVACLFWSVLWSVLLLVPWGGKSETSVSATLAVQQASYTETCSFVKSQKNIFCSLSRNKGVIGTFVFETLITLLSSKVAKLPLVCAALQLAWHNQHSRKEVDCEGWV